MAPTGTVGHTTTPTYVEVLDYGKTKIGVAYTSLTDPEVRERTRLTLRELATLIEPSNAKKFGAQMVGFEVQLSATECATANLVGQAATSSVAIAAVKEDL